MKKSTLVLAIASVLALPSSAQTIYANTEADVSFKADAQMKTSEQSNASEPSGEQAHPPASLNPSPMSLTAQGDARGSGAMEVHPSDSSPKEEAAERDGGISGAGELTNEAAGSTTDLAGEGSYLLKGSVEHTGNVATSLSQSATGQIRAGAEAGLTTAVAMGEKASDLVSQTKGTAKIAAQQSIDTAAQVRIQAEERVAAAMESASLAVNAGADVAAQVSRTVNNEVSKSVSAAAATAVNATVTQQVNTTVADQVASEVAAVTEASVNQALKLDISR